MDSECRTSNYNHKEQFYVSLESYYAEKPSKKPFDKNQIDLMIVEIEAAKTKSTKKTRREYNLLNKYDVMRVTNQSFLIKKHVDAAIIEFVVPYEELFDKIYDFHVNKTGHGGRCKIESAFADKFQIPRPPIEIFLSGCKSCNEKRNLPKKLVVKPILSSDFCERGQIDLIDFQSLQDGDYKWILNYQDHSTKFVILRPLTSKRAQEIASELLSIFLLFGAPKILQSDNGREFVNSVIEDLHKM
ncbi:KRAB-A domain-containing protein 2-like [Microplitis mediator]|uniref:KRAB-A domain-containing protein 2-like n=1 Tax=Microplitis mediator TaxID=375433 RepID=UPI002554835F|nr:KRAB-A domain-containing protein 2-like [Microplitis mediator]